MRSNHSIKVFSFIYSIKTLFTESRVYYPPTQDCLNGGFLVSESTGRLVYKPSPVFPRYVQETVFACTCQEGFTGEFCETSTFTTKHSNADSSNIKTTACSNESHFDNFVCHNNGICPKISSGWLGIMIDIKNRDRLDKLKKRIMTNFQEQIMEKYSKYGDWILVSNLIEKIDIPRGESRIAIRKNRVVVLKKTPQESKKQTHFVKIVDSGWTCDCDGTGFAGKRCLQELN